MMGNIGILFFLTIPIGSDLVVFEKVGWIERNRVYNSNQTTPHLDQIIFWDLHPVYGIKECRGWIRTERVLVEGPRVTIITGQSIIVVEGLFLRETTTLYDPEVENRIYIPTSDRRLVTRRP